MSRIVWVGWLDARCVIDVGERQEKWINTWLSVPLFQRKRPRIIGTGTSLAARRPT